MLITNGTDLRSRPLSLRIADGHIVEIDSSLSATAGEDVVDACGGTVIPGLHDHHIHLRASVAAATSLQIGPPTVNDSDAMRRALASATVGPDGWIRAIGYHESVGGDLDRTMLDSYRADVPVRVQHRSGALWTVNTAGLAVLDVHDKPDGRFYREDIRFRSSTASADLASMSAQLSSMGVTGCTDATPGISTTDLRYFEDEIRAGRFRQSLHLLARDDGGGPWPFTFGPVKKILDDVDLDLNSLTDWVGETHGHGQPVAIHCVTAVQLLVALMALRSAGRRDGDRIEHAAVVTRELMADLTAADVTVVTQPNFIGERGERYLHDVESTDRGDLWRVASLMRAGISVCGSTDAPFGKADPWASMRDARDRMTASGHVLGPDERVSARTALNLFLGNAVEPSVPRTLIPGSPANLCVLNAPPTEVLDSLSRDLVRTTVIGGSIVHG